MSEKTNAPLPPQSKRMRIERPHDAFKTLTRLLSYLKGHKTGLFLILAGILCQAAAMIAVTYMIKPAVNDYILPLVGTENTDLIGLKRLLSVAIAVSVAGAAGLYLYQKLTVNLVAGLLNDLRTELFGRMQRLPISFFDTHPHGELMSTFTNDVDAVREMLSMGLPQLVLSAVSITGVFSVMLFLSPVLTGLVVFIAFVMLFGIKKIASKSAKIFKRQQAALADLNACVEESIDGQKVVKVFTREAEISTAFAERNQELFDKAKNANTFANILMPIMGNLSYVLFSMTSMAGGFLAIRYDMDLGTIAAFLQYIRAFTMPITQISVQLNSVLSALAGAERIFRFLDVAPETDDGYVTLANAKKDENGNLTETVEKTELWVWRHPHSDGTLSYTKLNGNIVFENVSFGYTPERVILRHINLNVKAGQKIAFIGSTGAGKTTLTNLVNRFYEITDGKIRYDGINVRKIKKDDLRRSLATVLQDTHLFTGTVAENIRYGRTDATDEDIIAAAKSANADSFIRSLPQGYETVLTADGSNLSQGQRQLIAITRALVADPPVLILDEATSSIDTRTEQLITQGLEALMKGRTVFIIAHRLSTVRNADHIVVLENGAIMEQGSHSELLALNGRYAELLSSANE